MSEHPKVSVIIPVYNAEKYLQKTLDSLCRQTLKDFEVICVDDGSSDNSLAILRQNAEKDPRFRVLTQQHQYAGAARNLGTDHAEGKYLIFLDADDLFYPDMLEAAWSKAENNTADICVFPAEGFFEDTGKTFPMPNTCRPGPRQQGVFSRKDDPDEILTFTGPAPWNKLYRRDFVLGNGLRFQHLQNSNDVAFVISSLAFADRICTLDKPLLRYRAFNKNSLQGSKDRNYLAFYEAQTEVERLLRDRGLYVDLERSFINCFTAIAFYNLNSVKSTEAFEKIYELIRNTIIPHFRLTEREEGYLFLDPESRYAEQIKVIQSAGILDYMNTFGNIPRVLKITAAENLEIRTLFGILTRRLKNKLSSKHD